MTVYTEYWRLGQRRRTAAAWTSVNEVLFPGEMGLETDTRKFKFGDGSTAWTALAYSGSAVSGSDVTTALGYTPTSVTGLTGVQSVSAFKSGLAIAASDVSGLGTAAAENIGTSGSNLGKLNANLTWSGSHSFSAEVGFGVVAVAGLPRYARKSSGTVDYADNGTNSDWLVSFASGSTTVGNSFGGGALKLLAGNAVSVDLSNSGPVAFPRVGTTASAANAYLDAGSSPANNLLRSTSSARYKDAFEPVDPVAADRMLALQPVWYRSLAPADRKGWSWYGYTAEDVAAIDPRCVTWVPEIIGWSEVPREVEALVRPKKGRPYLRRKIVTDREPIYSGKMIPDGVMYDRVSLLREAALLRRLEALEARLAELAPQS